MLNAQEIRGKITSLGLDFSKLYKSSVPMEISMEMVLTWVLLEGGYTYASIN